MTSKSPEAISGWLKSRESLVPAIIMAVLVSASIGFFSSLAVLLADRHDQIFLVAVLFVALLALGALGVCWLLVYQGRSRVDAEYFFVQHPESRRIADILDHEYSGELSSVIGAACLESEAIRRQWMEGFAPPPGVSERAANLLVEEATEYFLLDQLSHSIDGALANRQANESDFDIHDRQRMSHVLLTNRLLELLSRPVNDRDWASARDGHFDGGVIHRLEDDGRVYERLELLLPKGSVVSRPANGTLLVDSPLVRISLSVDFAGFSTVMPHLFLQLYLGMYPDKDGNEVRLSPYMVHVTASVEVKWKAVLSFAGWRQYVWIDDFLARVHQCDETEFLKRIGYSGALTTILGYFMSRQTVISRCQFDVFGDWDPPEGRAKPPSIAIVKMTGTRPRSSDEKKPPGTDARE